MIRIKDYIFNENEINKIRFIPENTKLLVDCYKNEDYIEIRKATFEDIEWNYENNNEYYNVFYEDRIKELEEENKKLKEQLDMLVKDDEEQQKTIIRLGTIIDKAIEYIEEHVAVCGFGNKALPHWEFDDDNIQDLLKILKGEE